ncbi:MAG TPA: hypothetical protein VGG51_04220 [Candidatus Cybelea sp.]
MKAAIIRARDGVPEYGSFAEPILGEGHELVSLVAAGIHPIVRALASGRHYGSAGVWPLIPGLDAVARTADGDLIYTGNIARPYGTLAERMAVPQGVRISLPPEADPVQIAGGVNPGLASWLTLNARKREIGLLGSVLILGVTGMAGSLAAQNARVLGATRIVGAGRNAAALERIAKADAKTVSLIGDPEADADALHRALGETAPSIVLDFLWAGAAEAAFRALGRHGLDEDRANISYVEIGAMAGPDAAVPASLLRSRHIRISGSGAGSASIADVVAQIPIYMQLIADHKIDVPTQPFTLSSIADAWAASESSGRRAVVVP